MYRLKAGYPVLFLTADRQSAFSLKSIDRVRLDLGPENLLSRNVQVVAIKTQSLELLSAVKFLHPYLMVR